MKAGQADYDAGGLPPTAHAGLAQQYGINKGRYFVSGGSNIDYVALNTSRPAFARVAMRKAAQFAVDRPALVRQRGFLAGRRRQHARGKLDGAEPLGLAHTHGALVRIEQRLGATFDMAGELGADVRLVDGSRRRNAGILCLALEIGDNEERLTCERVVGIEHGAAAIGQQETPAFATCLGDAVRPGVKEEGAGRLTLPLVGRVGRCSRPGWGWRLVCLRRRNLSIATPTPSRSFRCAPTARRPSPQRGG